MYLGVLGLNQDIYNEKILYLHVYALSNKINGYISYFCQCSELNIF